MLTTRKVYQGKQMPSKKKLTKVNNRTNVCMRRITENCVGFVEKIQNYLDNNPKRSILLPMATDTEPKGNKMAIEITTTMTNQEIFNSLVEVARAKCDAARQYREYGEKYGSEEAAFDAKAYENELNGIIDAILQTFNVSLRDVIRETTK